MSGRTAPKRRTRLSEMLHLYRVVKRKGLREVGLEADLSAPTIMRIEQGNEFDVATLQKLLAWLLKPETPEGSTDAQ